MNLRAGDKVKFLNARGGGIVKRIIDSRMVLVTIEDGFDIPTLASELVKVDAEDAGGRFFNDKPLIPVEDDEPVQEEHTFPVVNDDEIPADIIRNRKSEDVYLSYVPHDQKLLISGPVDLFIINNTSSDILYNLFRKNKTGSYSGADYGSAPAGTKYLIATIERDDLAFWLEGTIQLLFHKNECADVPPPYNAEFLIQGKKMFSDSGYRDNRMVSARAVTVKVATAEWKLPEQKSSIPESGGTFLNSDDFILKHKTSEKEAEVDLHIVELIEDPSQLQKHEILEYQKNYFIRCLESAMVNHFRKVIFIHGVGNGVLRDVLLDHLLKQKGIDVFDAPMSKYGVGAVEVRIRHNQ